MKATELRKLADRVEADWRAQQPAECQLCGSPRTRHVWPMTLETHEIVCGGPTRLLCRSTPAGMIALCGHCHALVTGMAKEDQVVLGLAVKCLKDPTYYDLEAVLAIWRPNGTEEWRAEIAAKVTEAIERMGEA